MPYTSVCDWIESCDYKCAKPVDVDEMTADTSTYDEYSARYRESTMKDRLRELFKKQAFYKYADFKQAFADIPEISLVTLLSSVVDNRSFQIQTANHKGFITFIFHLNTFIFHLYRFIIFFNIFVLKEIYRVINVMASNYIEKYQ